MPGTSTHAIKLLAVPALLFSPLGAQMDPPRPDRSPRGEEAPPTPPPDSPREGLAASRQADFSHFFAQGLPRGTIRELALDPALGYPKRLQAMERGLMWTTTGCGYLFAAMPDGLGVAKGEGDIVDFGWIPEKKTCWATSAEGRHLWVLPADAFDLSGSGRAGRAFGPLLMSPAEVASRPGSMVRSPNGVFHRLDDRGGINQVNSRLLYRPCKLKGRQPRVAIRSWECPDTPLQNLVACANGMVLGLARDRLLRYDSEKPVDSQPARVLFVEGIKRVIGSEQGIWYTCPSRNELGHIPLEDSAAPAIRAYTKSLGMQNHQVFDLALGPDGRIWFTELLHGAIGCLDFETGDLRRYPLPIPGSRAGFIVNGGDGKMYFTETGSHRLGCITAVEPPPPEPEPSQPEPGASVQQAEPTPSPEPAPEPAPAKPTPPAPVDYGAALVRLCPQGVNWRHLQEAHYYAAPNGKGQFRSGCSTDEQVARLIYHCVRDPLCPLFLTYEGKWMALRTFTEEIGYYLDRDRQWARTRNLAVVLSPDRSFVVTAYPVGPNF